MTYALGRIVQHDDRSRGFAARGASTQRNVLWGHHAPVLDQGNLGSCTGNALAQLINTDPFAGSRHDYLTEADAMKLYSLATTLDDQPGSYPPTDTGSSGLAVAKAGVKLGYFKAYNHAFGFDHFTAALQLQPVIVGTAWLDGMMQTDANGVLSVKGNVAGGHEYLALGVDYDAQQITFLNSWGPSWGAGGRFKVSFTDFSYLLSQQGDVTVPTAQAPTPPTPPSPETGCCEKLKRIAAIVAEK